MTPTIILLLLLGWQDRPSPPIGVRYERPVMTIYIADDHRCQPCNAAQRALRDAANLPFDLKYVIGLPEWSDTLPTFHWADSNGNGKMIRGWYGLTPTIEAFSKTQASDTPPAVRSGKP